MTDAHEIIRLVDLQAAHAEIAEEIDIGIRDVFDAAAYIKGPQVAEFEREFAAFCGRAYCVGVANGTDAIELALRAIRLSPGAEVVLPANTFVATAAAVVRAGGRPVFADVDPADMLLDPVSAASVLSANTAVLLPVHLYGQMAPMAALADLATKSGITLVEDAAQAHGATQSGSSVGSFSLASTFSFYPGKNLGAYGDAGAVVTDSADLARRIRLLGDHGSERKYEHSELGFNSRLDSVQAVVLLTKLRRLSEWNKRRRQAAALYDELLANTPEVTLPHTAQANEPVWHLYVVQVPRRDDVVGYLHDKGIQVGIHYPVPVHLQSAFRQYGYGPGDFPVAEAAAQRILSLPLYPHITADQQRSVADALQRALS